MIELELHTHRWEPASAPGAPTLLLLHGTGGDEHDLISVGRTVAPGAALLSPRGNVMEQGAPRFFRRLAEGVFDLDDLARRTGELGDFVLAAAEEYEFDRSRLYALGFSNGANVAVSLLLTRPTVLAGGALLRAMVPFEPAQPVALAGKPILLSAGRSDPLIPASQAEHLATILRASGAEVELAWQSSSHQLAQGDMTTLTRWLAQRST